MAEKKKTIRYSEPQAYFPKDVMDKYFGGSTKKSSGSTKKSSSSTKSKKK